MKKYINKEQQAYKKIRKHLKLIPLKRQENWNINSSGKFIKFSTNTNKWIFTAAS